MCLQVHQWEIRSLHDMILTVNGYKSQVLSVISAVSYRYHTHGTKTAFSTADVSTAPVLTDESRVKSRGKHVFYDITWVCLHNKAVKPV